jgi:hypothetical protein
MNSAENDQKMVALVDKICDVCTDAAALGIDLGKFVDDATKKVFEHSQKLDKEDLRLLFAALRPKSNTVQ